MTLDELGALIDDVRRRRARYTLEDAVYRDGTWVAYIYESRSGLTFHVEDYRAYLEESDYFPTSWISHEPRARRNGRDYSKEEAADLTLDDLTVVIASERRRIPPRLRAVHIRYDEWDDNRYLVQLEADGGSGSAHDLYTLAAYSAASAAP